METFGLALVFVLPTFTQGRMQVTSTIRVFSREQAAIFCDITPRRLTNWTRQGVVTPSVAYDTSVRPFVLIYDFTDLVCIRAITVLIEIYGFTSRQLLNVYPWFRDHADQLPPIIHLETHSKPFRILEPDALPAEYPDDNIVSLELTPLIADLMRGIEQAQQRQPEDIGRISRHRQIQHNAPVIAGTRIPTSTIWNYHEDGYTENEILEQFPHITPRDIVAAITFEARRRHAA